MPTPREVALFELIMAGLSDVHASKSSAAVVPVMVLRPGIACKSRIVGLCRRSGIFRYGFHGLKAECACRYTQQDEHENRQKQSG